MKAVRLTHAAAICASIAYGQNVQISGLIQDPSTSRVAGADVDLRNEQTGGKRVTRSNDAGVYTVVSLNPGVYRITVRAAGFETIIRDAIKLDVGENARIDFSLRLGDSRTQVTVHGGAPLMNMENASVGTVIDRGIIDQMPLNGRGLQSLIELSPGTVVVPVVDANRGQFAINGQRTDANSFTLDGVSLNFGTGDSVVLNTSNRFAATTGNRRFSLGQAGGGTLPANNSFGTFGNLISPDALEEFRIQTSSFAPEYGRTPGAQVELISRSGGNRYAGSLSEYLRNEKTDANDWFSNQLGVPRLPLRLNDFGGTLSGPVRIPRLYNGKDRTFFFLAIDNILMAQPRTLPEALVPTLQARRNAPPGAASFLNAFPLPNRASDLEGDPAATGLAGYIGRVSLLQKQLSSSLRLDHNFTAAWTSFGRYSRARFERTEPVPLSSGPANIQTYTIETEILTVGLTHTLTPRLVHEIRLNRSSQVADASDKIAEIDGARRPADSQLFPPGYSSGDSSFLLSISGTPDLTTGFISQDRAGQLQFISHLSYSKGSHLFKAGVDYRGFSPAQVKLRSQTFLSFPGIFGAGGAYDPGIPSVGFGERHVTEFVYGVRQFSTFAQDSWKVNRRLAVTYGVRWEINPAPRTTKGQASVLTGISDLGDLSTGRLAPSGTAFYPTSWSNLAPRVGVGWQILDEPERKTVLRVGAGRFFDLAQAGFGDAPLAPSSFYQALLLRSPPAGPAIEQPLGTGYALAAAPRYNLPAVYEWNVTLEQSIRRQTFSVGYVGALGQRLIGSIRLPAPPPFTTFDVLSSNAASSYHSMQAQFNRRLSDRLRVLLSYTWSHSIDDVSSDLPGIAYTRSLAEYLHPEGDRGSSDFDIRHSVNGSLMITLPSPRSGMMTVLFRNWSGRSIFFARSAVPSNILSSDGIHRADLVAGQDLYLFGPSYPGGKRYNDEAFTDPPAGMQGSLGRNALRGFGAWQIDFALHRVFRISEQTSLQFRAEAFNIFNHPNFMNPGNQGDGVNSTLRHDSTFGVSAVMLASGLGSIGVPGQLHPLFQFGGPRSVQFALRLSF